MVIKNDKPIFDAVRTIAGALSQRDVDMIKAAILAAGQGQDTLDSVQGLYDVSPEGVEDIKSHEGCKLKAYPDPGSRDGEPWTIGYGATGPGIHEGVVWTQEQADMRFLEDLRRFENGVEEIIGTTPTTQDQFDALVSFAYNVGLKAFSTSTLLRKHRKGDFMGAADEFGRWVYNDGKKMKGLVNRRTKEASVYRGRS